MGDLDKLIAAVEAGTFLMDMLPPPHETTAYDAFSGSLDAAMRLHEALLPGWAWGRFPGTGEMYVTHRDSVDVPDCYSCAIPARAWLLAILRALKAKGEP